MPLKDLLREEDEKNVVNKTESISDVFNEMIRAANAVASCLDRLGVSMSKALLESDDDWVERLKKEDPAKHALYDEIVQRLHHLDIVIAKYKKMKNDKAEIVFDKSLTEMFFEYIPDVRKQMRHILKPPESQAVKDFFEKIKNTYCEFMAKAKYIIGFMREIDPTVPDFDTLYNS